MVSDITKLQDMALSQLFQPEARPEEDGESVSTLGGGTCLCD